MLSTIEEFIKKESSSGVVLIAVTLLALFLQNSFFTDLTKLPLAKMYDKHELISHGDHVELKSTISISGPLAFLWKHLIAKGIVASLPAQTENLLKKVRDVRK